MDKRTLVDPDIDAGRRIVEVLDDRGIPVDVAAWLQDDESETWQLLIASPIVVKEGPRRIYQEIQPLLLDPGLADFELDDVLVASANEYLVRDLKRLVRTGDELQLIRLGRLNLGFRYFRYARIYRVRGGRSLSGWLERDARVRVKTTGQLGTVRGAITTPSGKRYFVLRDLTPEDLRPLDGSPRPAAGQDYAEQDLEFLYAVRPGGQPERPPKYAQPA